MAVDKLVDSTQLDSDLTSVANAIRAKSGGSGQLAFPSGFVSAIQAIQSGGDYVAGDWLDLTKPTGFVEGSAAITNQWPPVFKNRTGISGLSIPNATELPADFCNHATSLSEVYAPQVAKLNGYCFNTTAIEYAVFPAMRNLYGGNDFAGCANLLGADFGGTFVSGDRGITTFTFSNSTKMAVLVLRSSVTWALQNISAFNNTPFASGKAGGTLYVPQALISSYQSATNWSTILGYANNQIKAIEGSAYATKYVDGTTITT